MGRRKPDDEGPLDPRRIGRLAHQIVSDRLVAVIRQPSPSEALAFVGTHELMGPSDAVVSRQATRMRVSSAVVIYFRYFTPPPEWRLEGPEIAVGSCRFDLVGSTPGDPAVVDELKAARRAALKSGAAMRPSCRGTSKSEPSIGATGSEGCGS